MKDKITRKCVRLLYAALFAIHFSLFTSCNDFLTIYPTDKTVGEDFWKKKADVDEMVDGAYLSMLNYGIQERAIVWGAFRSDELVKESGYSNQTLDNISAVNLLPTNDFNNWAAFYKVINNCNIVLRHAPEVTAIDPEFTEGDYQVVRAQMLSLRSLCYFYLVRAFRDIPYTSESFEDNGQDLLLAQSSPAVVLQHCIDDLKEAEPYIMRTGAYGKNDWRNWGYFTLDAVHALLADIHLWRASMTGSEEDYRQTIAYVDQVIDTKDKYYRQNNIDNVSNEEADQYHLTDGSAALYSIFSNGNSHESILELQYNGKNNANTALLQYYYKLSSGSNSSRMMASSLFNTTNANANSTQGQKIYFSSNDYRFWNNIYGANNEEARQLSIRKMVESGNTLVSTTSAKGPNKNTGRSYNEFRQNWIVYRLTDLMLMKAEALTALASGDADMPRLSEAFQLVQTVNKRSMAKNAKDTLNFESYKSKEDMELLVLAERERELCFEGKRWWDLMRYSYRHMTGVDASRLLSDSDNWPTVHSQMLRFIVRKYGEDGQGDAVSYKMRNEALLYWPILESETKVNSLLKQNPVYVQENSTSKN